MKMKRTLCIVLAVLTALSCVLCLASCGNSNPGTKDLENIKAAGKIVVGMECDYKPYNWAQTTENEYTVKVKDGMYADGYDVQMAKKIAEYLGVTLEIKPMEWDGLIPALESGDIDAIVAGMSATEKRRLSIDFTDTYFNSNLVVVCKKDSAYASATKISDFKGAKITGQFNTFHYDVIDQIEGVQKQTALPNFAALTQALAADTVDGYVCEKPGAESAVASYPSFTFVEFSDGNGFTCNPEESSISVGVRKGSSLTEKINKYLATLTVADKDALMSSCIARQPAGE